MNITRNCAVARRSSPAVSRRRLARFIVGAVAFGGALGSGFFKPGGAAAAAASFAPLHIPGGTPMLGGAYHIFGPAGIDPIDAEPSSITNFDGFVGLAYISGMVTQINTKTGESQRFPFVNSDMRFMKGNFQGTDGKTYRGTFGLV